MNWKPGFLITSSLNTWCGGRHDILQPLSWNNRIWYARNLPCGLQPPSIFNSVFSLFLDFSRHKSTLHDSLVSMTFLWKGKLLSSFRRPGLLVPPEVFIPLSFFPCHLAASLPRLALSSIVFSRRLVLSFAPSPSLSVNHYNKTEHWPCAQNYLNGTRD